MQRAMYWVSPFGERRADIRAAHVMANWIGSQAKEKIPEADYQQMFEHLMNYLPCDKEHDPGEEQIDREALRRVKEQ